MKNPLKPNYRRENITQLFVRTIYSMHTVQETYDETYARLKRFAKKQSDFEIHNRALKTAQKLLEYEKYI